VIPAKGDSRINVTLKVDAATSGFIEFLLRESMMRVEA
jgi:hypothetical protein